MANRTNCTICGHHELENVLDIRDFPVFMGATQKPIGEHIFNNLEYCRCTKCNNLQIKDLIPLDVLYQDNHNVDVVGKTWEEHNEEFAKFVGVNRPSTVMEIGSPSAKIFKKLQDNDWLDKWYSIEPNPTLVQGINNKFTIIRTFIDDDFTLESQNMYSPKAVVMSHVFEHFYNPSRILNSLHKNVDNGTEIIISIPNMLHISKNNLMPPCGLHFEHTYYVDLINITHLLNSTGFRLIDYYEFKEHSLFIRAVKSDKIDTRVDLRLIKSNEGILSHFNTMINTCERIVTETNLKISEFDGDVYLYGSHFPAQLLYSLGLNIGNVRGCLDQSKSKIGKTLYGTNLTVYHPSILEDKGEVMVICHMGPYTTEIKETVLGINDRVIFV